MVSAGVTRTVVGIIGNVISCGLFLSPIPTFLKIYKKNTCEFGLVVGARSTMLDECYSDTPDSKEVTGSIIRMCKKSHAESFNLNPSPARSGSSLGHHFRIKKIYKKNDVESFDPKLYLATVLNCLFWIYYGMPFVNPDSTLVVTINGVGLGIELIYLGLFFYYAAPKGRKRVLIYLICEVAFFAGVVILTMLAIPEHKMVINRPMRAVVVGVICVVFNVIMYSSPLFIVRDVIRTKSVKYMPFFLSFANFLNGCCWTAYAVIGKLDYFILISNGLGSLAGLVQLIVYACYYKTTPKDEDLPAKPTNEVQLHDL